MEPGTPIRLVDGGPVERKPIDRNKFHWKPSKIRRGYDIADETTVIIPVKFEDGSLRAQALQATIDHLVWSGIRKDRILVSRIEGEWNKGAAINEVMTQVETEFLMQLDGDLLPDLGGFFAWLSEDKKRLKHPIMPWPHFVRLGLEDTKQALRKPLGISVSVINKQVQRGRGAGGFFVPTDQYIDEPMRDDMVGWAGEDLEFANRMKKAMKRQWLSFSIPALHHHHENDRKINTESLQNLAEEGVIKPNKEVVTTWGHQRVAIVAEGRSGGNLLQELLAQHPDLTMLEKEPLSPLKEVRRYGDPPEDNVEAWLRSKMQGSTNMHGVRVLVGQPAGPQKRKFLTQLIRRGWFIIRLTRENEFEMVVSRWLAKEEKNYIGEAYKTESTKIPKHFARRMVSRKRELDRAVDAVLVQAPKDRITHLTYEELAKDPVATAQRMARFLGLSVPFDPEITLKKQLRKPAEEVVTNHEDIKDVIERLNVTKFRVNQQAKQITREED